jgi:hypothetical protein
MTTPKTAPPSQSYGKHVLLRKSFGGTRQTSSRKVTPVFMLTQRNEFIEKGSRFEHRDCFRCVARMLLCLALMQDA